MADETFLKGSIRILYIKDSSVWYPVSCLTSNPLNEEVEMLPTTTTENSGWETSLPTNQRYTIDFSGIQILTTGAGDTTKMSYDRIKILKRARTRIEWKIEDENQILVDTGFGYIQTIGEGNSVGDFLTFDGSIVGYGEPIFASNIPESDAYIFQDGNAFVFQDGNQFIFQ